MSLNFNQKIVLDLTVSRIQNIHCSQDDSDSRSILIILSDNGKPYYLSDEVNIFLKIAKPDNTFIYIDENEDDIKHLCRNDDGTISVILSQQVTSVPGISEAEIQLINTTTKQTISTAKFNIIVKESVLNDEKIESNIDSNIIKKMIFHLLDFTNPHKTNKEQLGLGNVPDVTTNDQTPTYEESAELKKLSSGEKLSIAFGKIAKATSTFISHIATNATTKQYGHTKLLDSVTSTSVDMAATPNSVKTVYNEIVSEISRATQKDVELENIISTEIGRAIESEKEIHSSLIEEIIRSKEADKYNADALFAETERAISIENTKAPLSNPIFTGAPKAPTATAGTNTTQIATTAFVQTAISNGIAASDAMIIKGTLGISGTTTTLPTTYRTGWTYRVVSEGIYAGQACELGDLVCALVNRDGTGNLNSDWCVAQTNIDGAITSIKAGDAYIETSQSGSVTTIAHKDVARTDIFSTVSPLHGSNFTAIKSITSDSKGHVTSVETETVSLPSIPMIGDGNVTIKQNGITKGTFNLNQNGDVNIELTDEGASYVHPDISGYKHIPSGGSAGQILRWDADGTATWGADNNTWIALKGATSSADGIAGYVPAPTAGDSNRYLRSDGTWQVPPDTNTTYDIASTSKNGLMSSTMVSRLGSIYGITSSLNTNNSNYALSAAGGYSLQTQINSLSTKLSNLFYIKTVQSQDMTIQPNEAVSFTASAELNGYTPIALAGFDCDGSGESNIRIYTVRLIDNTLHAAARNSHASVVCTCHMIWHVLYCKI